MIVVKVLHPTQHKIGHFGDAPQANLLAWYGKKENLAQKKHAFTNQKKCKTTQNKQNPGLVASYSIRPRNGETYSGFGAS